MREIYRKMAIKADGLRRRKELDLTLVGIAIGTVVGFMFGGFGLARAGGAVGIWGFAAGAVVFGIIGNRIGVEKDRAALARK